MVFFVKYVPKGFEIVAVVHLKKRLGMYQMKTMAMSKITGGDERG